MTWTPREALEADKPLIKLIIEWDDAVTAYEHPHETEGRIGLADKIGALEGQMSKPPRDRTSPGLTPGARFICASSPHSRPLSAIPARYPPAALSTAPRAPARSRAGWPCSI